MPQGGCEITFCICNLCLVTMKNKVATNSPMYLCLVLLQVPKYFRLVHIFCDGPKIYLHIVTVTNIFCQTKRRFAFSKIVFFCQHKVFEEAVNAVKFLGWLKNFGPAQNILGPVKGQSIKDAKESILYKFPRIYLAFGMISGFQSPL